MKKLFLFSLLSACYTFSFAQKPQSAGGCHPEDSYIMFFPRTADVINNILNNGGSYTAKIIFGMDVCNGPAYIKLNKKVIGKILSPYIENEVALDKFSLPEGVYKIQWGYSETDVQWTGEVTIRGTTGVAQVMDNDGITLYPIPTSDALNIDLSSTKEVVNNIRITDMSGREMKSQTIDQRNIIVTIPVNELPAGLYVVHLQTANGVLNRKIKIGK